MTWRTSVGFIILNFITVVQCRHNCTLNKREVYCTNGCCKDSCCIDVASLISPIGILFVLIPSIVLVSSIMMCWCRLRNEQHGVVVRQYPEQNVINAVETGIQQSHCFHHHHNHHQQQQLQQQQPYHQSWSNQEQIEQTYNRTEPPPSYTSLLSLEQQQQRRPYHNLFSNSEPVEQSLSNPEPITSIYDRHEQPPSYISLISWEQQRQHQQQQQSYHQSWHNPEQVAPAYDRNESTPSYNTSVLQLVPSSEDYQPTLSPKTLMPYLRSE